MRGDDESLDAAPFSTHLTELRLFFTSHLTLLRKPCYYNYSMDFPARCLRASAHERLDQSRRSNTQSSVHVQTTETDLATASAAERGFDDALADIRAGSKTAASTSNPLRLPSGNSSQPQSRSSFTLPRSLHAASAALSPTTRRAPGRWKAKRP